MHVFVNVDLLTAKQQAEISQFRFFLKNNPSTRALKMPKHVVQERCSTPVWTTANDTTKRRAARMRAVSLRDQGYSQSMALKKLKNEGFSVGKTALIRYWQLSPNAVHSPIRLGRKTVVSPKTKKRILSFQGKNTKSTRQIAKDLKHKFGKKMRYDGFKSF